MKSRFSSCSLAIYIGPSTTSASVLLVQSNMGHNGYRGTSSSIHVEVDVEHTGLMSDFFGAKHLFSLSLFRFKPKFYLCLDGWRSLRCFEKHVGIQGAETGVVSQ